MQSPLLVFLILSISFCVLGQENPDSKDRIQSAQEVLAKVSIDSLPTMSGFKPEYHSVDSIRSAFNKKAASLHVLYKDKVGEISLRETILNNRIDSLRQLKLSDKEFTNALDSIQTLRLNTFNNFTSKLDSLKAKTTTKLKELDLPPEYQSTRTGIDEDY
jgi:hypothetical protein